MSKVLEAWGRIKNYLERQCINDCEYGGNYGDDLIDIKTILEKYDYLIRNIDIFPREAKVGKKLKALEILKEILHIKIHIEEEENVAVLYVDIVKDFKWGHLCKILSASKHSVEVAMFILCL